MARVDSSVNLFLHERAQYPTIKTAKNSEWQMSLSRVIVILSPSIGIWGADYSSV